GIKMGLIGLSPMADISDFGRVEPAERDDLEAAAEGFVEIGGGRGGEFGRVGGVDVVAGAADDGLADGAADDAALGVAGVAVGVVATGGVWELVQGLGGGDGGGGGASALADGGLEGAERVVGRRAGQFVEGGVDGAGEGEVAGGELAVDERGEREEGAALPDL